MQLILTILLKPAQLVQSFFEGVDDQLIFHFSGLDGQLIFQFPGFDGPGFDGRS